MFFTWSFVNLIEQVFAECQWGSRRCAVGPALADCLEQKRLSPCGLHSEVGKFKNTLCGGDRRLFAPAREGQTKKDRVRSRIIHAVKARHREIQDILTIINERMESYT